MPLNQEVRENLSLFILPLPVLLIPLYHILGFQPIQALYLHFREHSPRKRFGGEAVVFCYVVLIGVPAVNYVDIAAAFAADNVLFGYRIRAVILAKSADAPQIIPRDILRFFTTRKEPDVKLLAELVIFIRSDHKASYLYPLGVTSLQYSISNIIYLMRLCA